MPYQTRDKTFMILIMPHLGRCY